MHAIATRIKVNEVKGILLLILFVIVGIRSCISDKSSNLCAYNQTRQEVIFQVRSGNVYNKQLLACTGGAFYSTQSPTEPTHDNHNL